MDSKDAKQLIQVISKLEKSVSELVKETKKQNLFLRLTDDTGLIEPSKLKKDEFGRQIQ